MPSTSSISTITSSLSPIKSSTMIASAAVGISLSMNANELQTIPTSVFTMSPAACHKCCSPTPPITSSVGSPIMLHHTPIRSRDIGDDMEQIRLSRQDNPYLQRVAGSQTTLVDEECIDSGLSDNEDTTQLVSQSGGEDALSLSEVHEHLIRSPPPTVVPKTISHFLFDTSFSDRYKTLPSLKVNFNQGMVNDYDDHFDSIPHTFVDSPRKLSVPKDFNATSASAPNSPARVQSRTDPYGRKPHTKPLTGEVSSGMLLGADSVPEDRCLKAKNSVPPAQSSKRHPQRVPEQVFLNKPLLSSVSSVNSPSRPIISPDDIHFRRNSSVKSTNSIPVNGSSLTLPIQSPHQPANTQVV